MKFTTQNSLLVARNVVNHFEMLLNSVPMEFRDIDTSHVILSVGSFQNGREQGLSISAWGVRLEKDKFNSACYYISEDRCCDAIVVYIGEWTNNSSDLGWTKSSAYFEYGNYAEAAKFIHNDIFSKLQAQSDLVMA